MGSAGVIVAQATGDRGAGLRRRFVSFEVSSYLMDLQSLRPNHRRRDSSRLTSAAIRTRRRKRLGSRRPEDWKAEPAKLRQRDRDARWTVKFAEDKRAEDGAKRVDVAIPARD